MALKMIGSKLLPVEPVEGNVAAPVLEAGARSEVITRSIEKLDAILEQGTPWNLPVVILAPKEVIGPVVPLARNLTFGTMVPIIDERLPVATLPMSNVVGYVPETVYSPAPTSIYGVGGAMGTIIVSLGKMVVAEIAADVSMDTLQRIGQRVMKNARIRGRTVTADVARHVAVRGGNLRSGFLPNRKSYDGPCNWWEFWCWLW